MVDDRPSGDPAAAASRLFWPHKVARRRSCAAVRGARAAPASRSWTTAPIERIEGGARRRSGAACGARRRPRHRRRRGDAVLRPGALARVHGRLRRRHRARPAGQSRRSRPPIAQIWAAGDVCQIWSAEDNAYRFYYGWKNVKAMGELAARNMSGGEEPFQHLGEETLSVNGEGRLHSSFWDYD